MDKYDETYEIVVNVARAKMIMNAHKGDIEEIDPEVLLKCIVDEVEELKIAMHEPFDYFHIIEEVADILNFAVAAAHTALNGYRGRKKDYPPIHAYSELFPIPEIPLPEIEINFEGLEFTDSHNITEKVLGKRKAP